MKGQMIQAIYRNSHPGEWVLLETDCAIWELRFGGIQQTTEKRISKFKIYLPTRLHNKRVEAVRTDSFSLYIELSTGEHLVYSEAWCSVDNYLDFDISLISKREFDQAKSNWYNNGFELKEII